MIPKPPTLEEIENMLAEIFFKDDAPHIDIYHGWSGPETDENRYHMFSASFKGSDRAQMMTGVGGLIMFWDTDPMARMMPIKYRGSWIPLNEMKEFETYVRSLLPQNEEE